MKWTYRYLPIILIVVAAGCDQATGDGQLSGSLFIPDCVDGSSRDFTCEATVSSRECRAFDLDADFFALQTYPDNSAKLRMQRGGADFALADGIVFQIDDTRRLRGRLSESIPVGQNENVRAGLGLFARCPGSIQNFEITGSIVFEAFGLNKGDRIKGVIETLEIRDGRGENGNVLGQLHGDFDFNVQTGPPYQRFQE